MQKRRDYVELFEHLSSNYQHDDDDFLPKNILVSIFKHLDSPQYKTTLFQVSKRFFLVAHSLFYPNDLRYGYVKNEEATNLTSNIHTYLLSKSSALLTAKYVDWLSLSEYLSKQDKKIQIHQKMVDEDRDFDFINVDEITIDNQDKEHSETDIMLENYQ